jgi:hypothetical protein
VSGVAPSYTRQAHFIKKGHLLMLLAGAFFDCGLISQLFLGGGRLSDCGISELFNGKSLDIDMYQYFVKVLLAALGYWDQSVAVRSFGSANTSIGLFAST